MASGGEEWRWAVGFRGYYKVSNYGRVHSMDRVITNCKGRTYPVRGRILRGYAVENRYLMVPFTIDGREFLKYVHRLVAQAFVPNPDRLPQVNHKDGNKLNNRADNLEWMTASQNKRHAHANGLINTARGSKCRQAKLDEDDVKAILSRIASGETGRSVALDYGVSEATVSMIKHNKTWTHV